MKDLFTILNNRPKPLNPILANPDHLLGEFRRLLERIPHDKREELSDLTRDLYLSLEKWGVNYYKTNRAQANMNVNENNFNLNKTSNTEEVKSILEDINWDTDYMNKHFTLFNAKFNKLFQIWN